MAIFDYTDGVGAHGDDERFINSACGYVYTKIGRKRIENGKIFPEDAVSSEKFGYTVAISGCTALFGNPLVGGRNYGY